MSVNFTTTLTYKGQVTVPKIVRDSIGLKRGQKIDIYPTPGGFVGKIKKKSNILKFAGDLENLDDGKSLSQIIEDTQKLAAKEIVKRFQPK